MCIPVNLIEYYFPIIPIKKVADQSLDKSSDKAAIENCLKIKILSLNDFFLIFCTDTLQLKKNLSFLLIHLSN